MKKFSGAKLEEDSLPSNKDETEIIKKEQDTNTDFN
jgi:hypothetical protein